MSVIGLNKLRVFFEYVIGREKVGNELYRFFVLGVIY